MCGIIGYVGKKDALPLLMEGLKKESYRGYDSSGVAIFDGNKIRTVKAVGKLGELERKVSGKNIKGGVGIGHCLPPDTLIQMGNGSVKPIARIKDGETVLTVNPKTLTFISGSIKVFSHKSPRYMREIRTPSTKLEMTDEHKMFVWINESLQEKKAKDIVKGDVLIFPKHVQKEGVAKKIAFENVPVKTYYKVSSRANTLIRRRVADFGISQVQFATQAGIAGYDLEHMLTNDRNVRTDVLERVLPLLSIEFPSQGFISQHSIHGNFVTLPRESSPELLQIIGYFLGDGYVGERGLRFKDLRTDVLKQYQKLCGQVFNLSGRIGTMSDTAAYIFELNSLALAEWFKKNIKVNKEQLLEQIGQLPKDEIAGFLRGLFDAEGFVGEKGHQIGFGMTDELIVKTTQLLLLQFEVLCSISDTSTNRPTHWKRPYRLSISSRDAIENFLNDIGFTSEEKQSKGTVLVGQMKVGTSVTFKVLPFSKKALFERCRSFTARSILKKFLGSGRQLDYYITESALQKFMEWLRQETHADAQKLFRDLKVFTNGDVIFQQVISNKRGKSQYPYLYDLEVVPNANFFANGLLSHNSRWATHGNVTEQNAHPHQDCKGNIFVVHNGIIENFQILKEKLQAKGHVFRSQTDTEVLPHLVEHFFRGNPSTGSGPVLEDAVRKALQLVKGTYGIAVIAKEDPGKIVAARLSSPLVISMNDAGGFVASDPAALLSYSNKMIFLDDKEIAVVQPNTFRVTDIYNKPKEKEIVELEWTLEEAQKGGYPHFMLKEIMQHPDALANALRGRLRIEEGMVKLGGLELIKERLREIERIQILACGSASYVGRAGEYMLEEYAGIPTEVDVASEFRYRKPVFDKKTLSIFISQSGETADTLAALKEVKEKGGLTLGIVNVVGSSVAREVDVGVYIHAGPEIAVAATKSVTAQLAVMALITVFLGRQRQLSLVRGQRIIKELARLPELAKKVLERTKDIEKTAEKYNKYSNFFLIGRKYNFPAALEGTLKLKETAYVHAEGFGGGELKHGSLALIDENFPTIAICPSDSVYEKMVSNIQEIKARNGPVIALATEGNEEIKKLADDVIYIPKTLEMLTPILAVIPLQLFAYYMGILRGYDVDKPRNLAKSVTVE